MSLILATPFSLQENTLERTEQAFGVDEPLVFAEEAILPQELLNSLVSAKNSVLMRSLRRSLVISSQQVESSEAKPQRQVLANHSHYIFSSYKGFILNFERVGLQKHLESLDDQANVFLI